MLNQQHGADAASMPVVDVAAQLTVASDNVVSAQKKVDELNCHPRVREYVESSHLASASRRWTTSWLSMRITINNFL